MLTIDQYVGNQAWARWRLFTRSIFPSPLYHDGPWVISANRYGPSHCGSNFMPWASRFQIAGGERDLFRVVTHIRDSIFQTPLSHTLASYPRPRRDQNSTMPSACPPRPRDFSLMGSSALSSSNLPSRSHMGFSCLAASAHFYLPFFRPLIPTSSL